MKLTEKNIIDVFGALEKALNISDVSDRQFLIPAKIRVISNRYSKIGRPKNSDYNYVENPAIKELESAGWNVDRL